MVVQPPLTKDDWVKVLAASMLPVLMADRYKHGMGSRPDVEFIEMALALAEGLIDMHEARLAQKR